MAVKLDRAAKVVSFVAARERLRQRPRNQPRTAARTSVWKCRESAEITEELLQFHPVFRYLAE
jgi:hypothetical protein